MIKAFDTPRLRVFSSPFAKGTIQRDYILPRVLFVAFRTDVDRPMVCATALVTPVCPYNQHAAYLDWIEVSSEYRREGFGRELFAGLRRCLGRPIEMDGGTEAGEAWVEAMERGGGA